MTGLVLLQTIVWSLAIYGITQIIVESTIFDGLRKWLNRGGNVINDFSGALVTCFLCTSVWVSFILSWWVFSPSLVLWPHLSYGSIFIDGMIGSTIVWFMHLLEGKMSR